MRIPLTALILIPLTVAADPLLYKTLDGGQTWQLVLSGQPPPSSLLTPVAVGPANSQIAYLLDPGTSTYSLYSSTNSGAVWNQSPRVALRGAITSMLVDPGAPQNLYIAGAIAPAYIGGCLGPCISPGQPVAYKSTDGGGTWVSLAPIQGDGTVPAVLALDRQTPGRLLAGTNAGLFISTDYGATWGSGALTGAINCLSFDPQNATTVFAGTANGVMKSTDSGATWTAASSGFSQGIAAIALDPNHSGVLYAATFLQNPTQSGVYFSKDGGANWTRGALPSPYRYVQTIVPDPLVTSRVWAASDLGILLSNDAGATWASVASWPAGAFPGLAADSSGAIYASVGIALPRVHIDSAGSAASYAIPLAPGELASVFGASLATGTVGRQPSTANRLVRRAPKGQWWFSPPALRITRPVELPGSL